MLHFSEIPGYLLALRVVLRVVDFLVAAGFAAGAAPFAGVAAALFAL
jgi:hypothetical protein